MSLPTHRIIEASPERSDEFRNFFQAAAQAAYVRPELGITKDLFSEETFDRPELVAHFAGVCAVTENNRAWLALDADEKVIGIVGAKREPDYCELRCLYVSPELKGRGLGHELYKQVAAFAGQLPMRLDVVEYMYESISIYKHWGFTIDDTAGTPNYIYTWWPEQAQEALRGIYMVKPGPEE